VVHTSLWICSSSSSRERVLANPKFYGKPVYSIVQVANADEEDWFAHVLILFQVRQRNLCLVRWLENDVNRRGELLEDATGLKRLVPTRNLQVVTSSHTTTNHPFFERLDILFLPDPGCRLHYGSCPCVPGLPRKCLPYRQQAADVHEEEITKEGQRGCRISLRNNNDNNKTSRKPLLLEELRQNKTKEDFMVAIWSPFGHWSLVSRSLVGHWSLVGRSLVTGRSGHGNF